MNSKNMRYQLLLNLTALSAMTLLVAGTVIHGPQRYAIDSQSAMTIEGTSSLHDWTCTVDEVNGWIDAATDSAGITSVSAVEVTVAVDQISCKNGTMVKKTRKALKSEEYPKILYVLRSVEMVEMVDDSTFTLSTTGAISVAGVEKPLAMEVIGERLDDNRFRFAGQTDFLMTDFGIKPPTAMLGVLKTGDRVVVAFDVVAALPDA